MEIGVLFAGKYRIDRVLGRGGQGEVVQATNLQLKQTVAVKFLLPELAQDPTFVQRFLREARAAAQLKSEHVACVLDMGTLDDGVPYIVFEYLDGSDLKKVRRDELPTGLVVDLVLQATEALAEAHAKGIIHRDIKPANLFVTARSDGTASLKILDFGISKIDGFGITSLTSSISVFGTPTYMSPEQLMSSRDVDARSDIWSLGVVLYELVEGRVPFEAETLPQLSVKVMTHALPPITASVPRGLVEVIVRCLEKDPAGRFQTMGELAAALAPFARSAAQASVSVGRAGRISNPVIARSASEPVAQAAVPAAPARRRSWVLPVAITGVAAAAAGIVVALPGDEPPAQSAPPRAVRMAVETPPPSAPADAALLIAPPPIIDARDDRPDQTTRALGDAVSAFVAWSKTHPSAPCPRIDALGSAVPKQDPWGSPFVLTCSDQPADQVAGVTSAGPDRKLGTDDDLHSWDLAADVVAGIKGPHWGTPASRPGHTVVTHKPGNHHPGGSGSKPPPPIVDRDGDGIPDVR